MKGIILEIDTRSLGDLLHLPEGAVIDDIQRNINTFDRWLIRVKGAGPEVSQGSMLPRMTGTFKKRIMVVDVNWGVL